MLGRAYGRRQRAQGRGHQLRIRRQDGGRLNKKTIERLKHIFDSPTRTTTSSALKPINSVPYHVSEEKERLIKQHGADMLQ